ncbi:hypothetical protein CR105_24345 [Massilia eurypsychrophila]|uniref:Uncharacterized protein n=1 Tax=Massilia eurypsychrophila TaxID=1485217 RepID=A0A2G8T8Q0_9BURK|nr:hypothetical protein [Massilia eurypsychrophila]PIL42421.1 hypothetical protein CR105_24345 [Massilia eurypsychrophila]
MKQLFLAECRRFRNAALIFSAVHLCLQLFVSRIDDVLQMAWEKQLLALALYLLSGFGFALYQFASWRQPGRWLWLLHRPLSRAAIFGAIALASTSLILFAVGLPALITVLAKHHLGGGAVDLRHYLLVVHVALLTIIAWLAGAFVVINGSRSAIVILVLPYLMLAHLANGVVMLLPALLCTALLAFTVYGAFKPDRTAPPATGAALLATSLPLLFGFYLAIAVGGSVAYQFVQMAADVHPLNRAMPPAGAFTELTRADGRTAFLTGLAASNDQRAPQWRRQIPLLDVADIEPAERQFPLRNQAVNKGQLVWTDPKQNILWSFSHDAMLFRGRDVYTAAHRGWMGANGVGDTTPFAAVPMLAERGLMTPQQYYAIAPHTQKLRKLVDLKAPETLAGGAKQIGARIYVLTNERLIAYAKPADADVLPTELFSVALPGPVSDLDRVDIATLLDGTLLSFNPGRNMVNGESGSTQAVLFVDAAGHAEVVARRPLAHDFSLLFEHKDWWLSPLLHTAVALPDVLLDKGIVLDKGLTSYVKPLLRPRPWPVLAAALLGALLAAGAAWWWLRPVAATRRRKAGWIAAVLLIGPPALACLMELQSRPPRLAAEHTPAPAAA